MPDQHHRRELKAAYKESRPEAGAIASSTSAPAASFSARPPIWAAFATSWTSPSPPIHRPRSIIASANARAGDLDSFTFEVREVLEIRPEMTERQIQDDLATLEALWREKLGPAELY